MNLPFLSSVESQLGKIYFLIWKFLAKIYEAVPEPVLELVHHLFYESQRLGISIQSS